MCIWCICVMCVCVFFFANKPKAPSVCKLFTIYRLVSVLFFSSYFSLGRIIWSACLSSLSRWLSKRCYIVWCIVFFFLFVPLILVYPRFVCNYKKLQCIWGWINSYLYPSSSSPLCSTDFIYRNVCVGCWIELPVPRSVDVNVALS